MAEPFLGEIRAWPINFVPKGWMVCDGSTLAISDNTALFSLLGTTYGGNGQTTFGLPDLRGRVPVHAGTYITRGAATGTEEVTLTAPELPGHTHAWNAVPTDGTSSNPAGCVLAKSAGLRGSTPINMYGGADQLGSMAPGMLKPAGGGQAHSNVQPSTVIQYCIATAGIYPSRN